MRPLRPGVRGVSPPALAFPRLQVAKSHNSSSQVASAIQHYSIDESSFTKLICYIAAVTFKKLTLANLWLPTTAILFGVIFFVSLPELIKLLL